VGADQRVGLLELISSGGRAKDVMLDIRSKSEKVIPMLWSAEIVTINNSPCLLASAVEFTKYRDYAEKDEVPGL